MPKRINRWSYDRSLQTALAATQAELDTTKSELNTAKAAVVQVGDILLLSNNTVRTGYLLCNGANVSRTTYAALFAKIGTTYGAGNGSTTFTLPNMNNRYPIGPGTNALGKYINEQLPNVSGWFGSITGDISTGGAFNIDWAASGSYPTDSAHRKCISFNAVRSSSVYTDYGRVYPYSLALYYVIKC